MPGRGGCTRRWACPMGFASKVPSVRVTRRSAIRSSPAAPMTTSSSGVQTLLHAEFDVGSGTHLTFGGELLDSRFIAGNETGGAATEINTLEPAQAYLAWRPHDVLAEGAKLDLTAGRFTMDVGSRRLVARANYRSILATFDGVRAIWTTKDKLAVTLAYTAPVTREPADAASALDNEVALDAQFDNVRLGVAHLDMPPAERPARRALSSRASTRTTAADAADAQSQSRHGRRPPAPPAGQRQVRLRSGIRPPDRLAARDHQPPRCDIARPTTAQMAHVEAGFSFDAPWSPRLALQYDFASGDARPPPTARASVLIRCSAIARSNLAPPAFLALSRAPITCRRPASALK